MKVRTFLKMGVIAALITGLAFSLFINKAEARKEKYVFYYVSHDEPSEPFWGVVYRGMKDADRLLGPKVEAHYVAPSVFSISKLVTKLESVIAAKPDGIVCTITSYRALDEPLRRAIKMGIPVIAANVADPRPLGERIPYLTFIGQNLYMAGRLRAERMLQEKGFTLVRGLCATGEPENIAIQQRIKGTKDVLREKGIPCDTLAMSEEPAKAVSELKSYFLRHPDTNAVFTSGSIDTSNVVALIEELGLTGKVKVGIFDLSVPNIEALKKGIGAFIIDQQPYLQGFLPIMWLYLYNEYGLTPPPNIYTGQAIVDMSNVSVVEELVKEGYR